MGLPKLRQHVVGDHSARRERLWHDIKDSSYVVSLAFGPGLTLAGGVFQTRALIFIPFILQAIVITLDEFVFHVKRGLPNG